MKITEQELERRKNRIITTAFQLFCRHGIEQVSLADIARQAGVGNSAIYRYFTNKPLLVLATLSVLWRAIGERLESQAAGTEHYDRMTGYEQCAVQLEGYRRLYMDNSDYVLFSYESKLYLQRNGVALSKQQYDHLMEEIREPCMAALEKGKADGSIPSDRDTEDLFYSIWGAVRGYIVKIVIYQALCRDENPWESRYTTLEDGILSALSAGWMQQENRQNQTRGQSLRRGNNAEKHETEKEADSGLRAHGGAGQRVRDHQFRNAVQRQQGVQLRNQKLRIRPRRRG